MLMPDAACAISGEMCENAAAGQCPTRMCYLLGWPISNYSRPPFLCTLTAAP